jgi:rRNA maturation endonuclease Nob1
MKTDWPEDEMKRLIEIEDIRTPLHAGGIVQLKRATLCVNCEHISEADGDRCPRCGSASLLSLARILNRKNAA